MENKSEAIVTMSDVLAAQEEAEDELDHPIYKNCTNVHGYARQPIYGCNTCIAKLGDKEKVFGICAACSLNCHEDHEVFELYTKRRFRCDCGTARAPADAPCTFDETESRKTSVNVENEYNHNYKGKYCFCNQPYQDENEDKDMYQCVTCEDWFHHDHIDSIPKPELWDEFICRDCTGKYPFLLNYRDLYIVSADDTPRVLKEEPSDASNAPQTVCTAPAPIADPKGVNTFWCEGWRQRLCRCPSCLALYAVNKLEYITDDEEDLPTQLAEEEEKEQAEAAALAASQPPPPPVRGRSLTPEPPGVGDKRGARLLDKGMEAMSHIPGDMAAIMLENFGKFRMELFAFLEECKASGQVVTKEDVQAFFAKLEERKRAKREL